MQTRGSTSARRPGVMVIRLLFTLLLVACVAFIFSHSRDIAEISSGKSQVVTQFFNNTLAGLGIGFQFSEFLVRKLGHFAEFAALGGLAMLTLRVYTRRVMAFSAWPLLFGLCIAVVDEWIQLYVPGRSSQVTDVALDFVGVVFGAGVALVVLALFHILRPKGRRAAQARAKQGVRVPLVPPEPKAKPPRPKPAPVGPLEAAMGAGAAHAAAGGAGPLPTLGFGRASALKPAAPQREDWPAQAQRDDLFSELQRMGKASPQPQLPPGEMRVSGPVQGGKPAVLHGGLFAESVAENAGVSPVPALESGGVNAPKPAQKGLFGEGEPPNVQTDVPAALGEAPTAGQKPQSPLDLFGDVGAPQGVAPTWEEPPAAATGREGFGLFRGEDALLENKPEQALFGERVEAGTRPDVPPQQVAKPIGQDADGQVAPPQQAARPLFDEREVHRAKGTQP